MAEFVEIIEQRRRMCKSYENCHSCGLFFASAANSCDSFIENSPQKAEEVIMKWANTHPIQTNADKFKEVFGIPVNLLGYEKNGCACFMRSKYLKVPCTKNDCKYKNFWGKEYIHGEN